MKFKAGIWAFFPVKIVIPLLWTAENGYKIPAGSNTTGGDALHRLIENLENFDRVRQTRAGI